MRRRHLKKRLLVVLGLALVVPTLSLLALLLHSWSLPLPQQLTEAPTSGRRIEDRGGMLLARTRADDDVWRVPLRLEDAGHHLANAMVAAEDKRFFQHPGIDPLSICRAGAQALYHGRLVSGASTITQQLARTTFDRPRTLAGKWREMAIALRIEQDLEKEKILEEYLNRVSFGPKIIGARAASDHYFGKPLHALDLSEAAALAGLVRGPSLFDPRHRPDLAQRERDRVLRRMNERGFITEEQLVRATSLPLTLRQRPPLPGAHHWVRWVANQGSSRTLRTTLHGELQNEAEELLAQQTKPLRARGVTSAAAVILHNETGDILAYVGSSNFNNSDIAGQNDGVRALRQPGSTLKPFAYGLAMEQLGMTPATLLPDKPAHFRTPSGHYAPKNFDRRFRGTVRLRRALANSLNVPAVHIVDKLGVPAFLGKLRAFGFETLQKKPDHYGPALALGDGEVRLLDLAAAYSTLARGGEALSPRLFLNEKQAEPQRVLSQPVSALLTEILSDRRERRESFGAHNTFEFDFPVAVKTGTSQGFRDSWTIGYTRTITVAVWAGNFDGRATKRVSGAVGAGPIFRALITAAQKWFSDEPSRARPLHDVDLSQHAICAATGELSHGQCREEVQEWFAPGQLPSPDEQTSDIRESGIIFPKEGMTFVFDPAIPAERQRLVLQVSPTVDAQLVLNGTPLRTSSGRAEWPLRPGNYTLTAVSSQGNSAPVSFTVEPVARFNQGT